MVLSPAGTQALIYSSDVSSPQGDPQDWIRFTASSSSILISLDCTGNSEGTVQLAENGASVPGWKDIACGGEQEVTVRPGKVYLVQISTGTGGAGLNYVRYTLRVKAEP